ncbi:potassium channel family protein [Flavobacteriaceae bacterium S0862]|nr:potassium channel family protein [Flavobacteriaceae bacterium S0862]
MKKQLQIESVIASAARQSLKLNSNIMRLLQSYFLCNDVLKRIVFCFALLFSINSFSQNIKYKEYSYKELFQLIEKEKDSVFELSDALIVLDPKKDMRFTNIWMNNNLESKSIDSIIIDKEIKLNNVIFDLNFSLRDSLNKQIMAAMNHLVFKKEVVLNNSFGASFFNSTFKERFSVQNDEDISITVKKVQHKLSTNILWTRLNSCVFENRIFYSNYPLIDDTVIYHFSLTNSEINTKTSIENSGLLVVQMRNQDDLELSKNKILNKGWIFLIPDAKDNVSIEDNDFGEAKIFMINSEKDIPNFNFINNKINHPIILDLPTINPNANIGWQQLKGKLIHQKSFDKYFRNMSEYGLDSIPELNKGHFRSKEKVDYYVKKLRIEKQDAYNQEVKIRGKLYRLYKDQYQTQDANSAYMELKDLETQHLKFQFDQKPSFNKYFKWKVNQFLKVFSNYGTEPAKAVTFSFYVVLFFAFIYLFFPNSWDKHGKNRIVDRYNFFFKYMKRKSGIHEVYLEDQQDEIMSYDQFKNNILSSKQKVPKFFTATALPLYKWAISSIKISAAFLSKIDIMKGTWSELPAHKRFWKSVLLIGAFTVAVCYDVLIKMLNALMLSINTFTTLGFGEIPIKGLPRYLAIIQGFIGWFMLTIFSVSLISQLLN